MKKKSNIQIVYKVVSRDKRHCRSPILGPNSVYRSAIANILPKSFQLSYRMGRKTIPKKGKIMAFKHQWDAIQFASFLRADTPDKNLRFYVLRCQAKVDNKSPYIRYSAHISTNTRIGTTQVIPEHDLLNFWKNPTNPTNRRLIKIGTVYCNYIKPLSLHHA